MILTKTIDLGDKRPATIKQMKLGQVRQLLQDFQDKYANLNFQDLLGDGYHLITKELENFIELPTNETFDDLTWDDITKIWDVFLELNPFIQPLKKIVIKYLNAIELITPEQLSRQLSQWNTTPSS